MKSRIVVNPRDLPLAVELTDGVTQESYVLRRAGKRKFGLQLVKPDRKKKSTRRRTW